MVQNTKVILKMDINVCNSQLGLNGEKNKKNKTASLSIFIEWTHVEVWQEQYHSLGQSFLS